MIVDQLRRARAKLRFCAALLLSAPSSACINIPDEPDEATKDCDKDLQNDSDHCGACNWSCGGAACNAGQCGAEEIATGLQLNQKVRVDQEKLYWGTNDKNGLHIAKKNGIRLTGPTVNFPIDSDVDSTHVYYNVGNEIFRVKKTGENPELIGSGAQLEQIFVDTQWVYGFTWNASTSTAKILRTNKSTAGKLEELYTGNARIRWLTTDANNILWTAWDGVVRRLSKKGGSVDKSLRPNNNAWGVTIHAGTIYWCSADGIHRAPINGTQETQLASGLDSPRAIAVHGDHVFWTHKPALMMLNLKGGTPQVLAALTREVQALAVDEDYVYFFEYTGWNKPKGRGFRVRRPPPS